MKDLLGVAGENGFTILVRAVKAAGLTDALEGPGPFTLFAPTDAAFAKFSASTLAILMGDTAHLRRIVTHHLVNGRVTGSAMTMLGWAKPVALSGQALTIYAEDDHIRVEEARVTRTDIPAVNGVIHAIDSVLLPRPARARALR